MVSVSIGGPGSRGMGPFALLLLLWLLPACDSGKILVYPIDGSHWLNMRVLVEALHARGHQITVLRSSTSWYVSEKSPLYTSITIEQQRPQNLESEDFMSLFLQRSIEIRRNRGSLWSLVDFYSNLFSMIGENQEVVAEFVVTIFENKTLIKELTDTGYDLFLTDPAFPGGVLVAHYLKLPTVFNVRWIFNGEAHFAIAPSPLSFVPQLFSQFTDKMNFFQRLSNVFYHSVLVYMLHFVSSPPYQAVCERYFGPGVDVMSLLQGGDIWLLRGKPSNALPSDLEEFVESSGEHGVIIMTLGTLLGDLGPEMSEIIAAAFATLPQKVIWRHVGQRPKALGNNTRLVQWMPQNDLLGHPKTKVFVTHGGTNGLYEAIYHAVPVLGIPLIFDQFDNMERMKARGVADYVEITSLDTDTMVKTLQNLLDPEKQYKSNMLKLSQLLHDKPMKPLDSAMFWIEFVMRHKGRHTCAQSRTNCPGTVTTVWTS
ncbi:hypothetical protein WMY93_009622 [Mugilogobius chulae]|uniref:UDP-glucuronosyltransferase n=1 Tax=Mugilogobius chulae TaxID=88201 RepID=A0AAW0PFP8_9GOBI